MKKKIAILVSNGSIGKTLIEIIKKDKKNFKVTLLSADKNYLELIKQAKILDVKNLVIKNKKIFENFMSHPFSKKVNVYNNFDNFDKIFFKKNDFIMSSITGLDGLEPTINSIKYTKNILIANKEALICGWNLINKQLKKNKTNFIPVDSEHFSIWSLLQNYESQNVEKIYITASGGPFLELPKKRFNKIKPKDALKHPNWTMGKKITIDSSTLMNKVFEVIEAKNIFNIQYNKISILTHPKSYIHAILKLNNGLTKLLIHDPNMKIPIFNSLYLDKKKTIKTKPLNIEIINDLRLRKVDTKKFPLVKLLDNLPNKNSLYETILVTINDFFVHKFLENKISFRKLVKSIEKFSKLREFQKFKKISPKNVKEIYRLMDYVSLKINSFSI